MASVYVFIILMVAWYAGQVVMSTFGISIPGLRIAGGLIVAFIGFRMLFPQQKSHDSMEAKIKSEELVDEPTANIAFVAAGNAEHRRARDHRHADQYGIDGEAWRRFSRLGGTDAPPIIFALVGIILWGCLRSSGGNHASGGERGNRSDFAPDGLSAGLHGRTVYYQRACWKSLLTTTPDNASSPDWRPANKKACRWNNRQAFFLSSPRSGVVRLMIVQRHRPAAKYHD
ncbi:inner membrane protein [Raoultella planticola]|uniref:UPF0056 membrane protein n=1 Tax=Raoultella planticola TaxID=575 RepID=A0A485A1X3_RAOPL|nr:inner membrane protein [Raoultella planticola]